MFELPHLEFHLEMPDLHRERYTTRSILTFLRGHGRARIVEQAVPVHFNNDQDLMNWLSNNIRLMISNYLNESNVVQLENIFHSIQIWGGGEARHFYRNNNTLNVDAYRDAMLQARAGNIDNTNTKLRENFNYLNISFASKHYSFWTYDLESTTNQGPRQLPILDRLIFNLVYGKKSPDYRHYSRYLEDIYHFINQNQPLTVHSLERQLFNFADTPEGRQWITARLNNNNG